MFVSKNQRATQNPNPAKKSRHASESCLYPARDLSCRHGDSRSSGHARKPRKAFKCGIVSDYALVLLSAHQCVSGKNACVTLQSLCAKPAVTEARPLAGFGTLSVTSSGLCSLRLGIARFQSLNTYTKLHTMSSTLFFVQPCATHCGVASTSAWLGDRGGGYCCSRRPAGEATTGCSAACS